MTFPITFTCTEPTDLSGRRYQQGDEVRVPVPLDFEPSMESDGGPWLVNGYGFSGRAVERFLGES